MENFKENIGRILNIVLIIIGALWIFQFAFACLSVLFPIEPIITWKEFYIYICPGKPIWDFIAFVFRRFAALG